MSSSWGQLWTRLTSQLPGKAGETCSRTDPRWKFDKLLIPLVIYELLHAYKWTYFTSCTITFYQDETCISFHGQLTGLKMRFLNAIRTCVHECIFDPQRVLLRIPGSTTAEWARPASVPGEERDVDGSQALPPEPANTLRSLLGMRKQK